MNQATDALLTSTADFAAAWSGALIPGLVAGDAPTSVIDAERMGDAGLLAALAAGFAAKRHLDALLVRLAGQVAERSEGAPGRGLASHTGNSSSRALVADFGRVSIAEASRLCQLGVATSDRVSLLGARMPAKYAQVAAALTAGELQVDAAQWIVSNLDQARPRATAEDLVEGEARLVQFAAANPADPVRRLAIAWRDALDEDGIVPREEELVAARGLRRTTRPNGMVRYVVEADPVSAGFLNAAIDAQVGAALREPRMEAGTDADGCDSGHEEFPDGRTIAQLGVDALVELARHALGCTAAPGPLPHTSVVVRLDYEKLLSGLGAAFIDGVEQPVSASTARKLAADARIIPVVLGGDSQVLDLGRGGGCFRRRRKSPSRNATAVVPGRAAIGPPVTPRGTTSNGGTCTTGPPIWATGSCSVLRTITCCTATGGRSSSGTTSCSSARPPAWTCIAGSAAEAARPAPTRPAGPGDPAATTRAATTGASEEVA